MDKRELLLIKAGLENLSIALDASKEEVLDCMLGMLVSEEERSEILDFVLN